MSCFPIWTLARGVSVYYHSLSVCVRVHASARATQNATNAESVLTFITRLLPKRHKSPLLGHTQISVAGNVAWSMVHAHTLGALAASAAARDRATRSSAFARATPPRLFQPRVMSPSSPRPSPRNSLRNSPSTVPYIAGRSLATHRMPANYERPQSALTARTGSARRISAAPVPIRPFSARAAQEGGAGEPSPAESKWETCCQHPVCHAQVPTSC